MPFIDPFDLLQLNVSRPEDVEAAILRRAKQKLMADFELSGDGYIEWNGERIDKTTVIDLLDRMEDPAQRAQFWEMRKLPGLIDFLKAPNIQTFKAMDRPKVTENPALQRFCSTYIAPAFEVCLTRALMQSRWPDARYLLVSAPLLVAQDYEIGFKGAIRFVKTKTLALEEMQHPVQASFDPLEYYETAFIETLNKFPDAYQQVRNRYAELLGRFAIDLNAKSNRIREAWYAISAANDLSVDIGIADDNRIYRNRLKVLYDAELARTQPQATPQQRAWQFEIDRQREEREKAEKEKAEKAKRAAQTQSRSQTRAQSNAWEKRKSSGTPFLQSFTSNTIRAGKILGFMLIILLVLYLIGQGGYRGRYSSGYTPEIHIPKITIPKIEWKEIDVNSLHSRSRMATFRGDVSFYDSLASGFERKQNLPLADRPANGANPYEAIFPGPSPEELDSTGKVTFRNKSARDVVVIIEQGFYHEILTTRYIRSGGQTTVTLPADLLYMWAYNGDYWVTDLVTYDGKPISGFSKRVNAIGPINYVGAKRTDGGVSRLLMIRAEKDPAKVDYDGHELQQQYF
jgi:hypothetical protein